MALALARPADRVDPVFGSMHSTPRSARRFAPGAVLLALGLSAAPAGARTDPLPPGFSAGPFLLAPYLATSLGYDDNLFQVPENPQAESFTRTSLGLAARMPVSNSLLELRYQVDKRNYKNYNPRRPREQTAGLQMRFNFGSSDALIVNDTFTRGASDVRIVDEGGELTYRDQPFDYNRAEIGWQRVNAGRPSFIARVARTDLKWDPVGAVSFFDYSGWETAFEYRHPVSGRRWLRLYQDTRRYDHFEPGVDHATSEPYRKEQSDTLQAGIVGAFGRGHSYDVRAGYGKYRLLGVGAEYDGLVGTASTSLKLGGRTWVNAVLWRRPLPSFFPTYYIVNSLRVSVERSWLRNLKVGVGVEHSRNQYLDRLGAEEEIRKDQRYLWEAYFDWFVHPQLAVRLAAGGQRRDSTVPTAEFDSTGATLGVRVGWF